ALSAALLEGQRDDTNPGETVQVGVVNGERVIVDVLGKGPVYTGAVFQTGEAPEARMVIADDQVNASWIRTYSADEVTYSEIRGTSQWLQAQGNPIGTGVGIASLFLTGESAAGAADDSITATASDLFLEFDTAGNGHGVKFGAPSTGTPLRRLGFGDTGAQTTNASGQLVVTHGLGVAPVAVLWFDYAGNNPLVGRHLTGSLSSTTFTVAFRNSTTNAAAGSGVGVGGHWLALY
ncbi:MAG TPA: hypothetical protein VH228_11260, partial [Nocardioides sp.]|nr:hypothetical protein [Nocardioides sp.]